MLRNFADRVPFLVGLVTSVALGGCSEQSGSAKLQESREKSQVLVPEKEPNPATSVATPIEGRNVVLKGHIFPAGDVDLYSFAAAANDRVYATTQTVSSPTVNDDTRIAILDSDGITVIEEDNNDGSAGFYSSSIAGARLLSAGTYYVRVTGGTASELVLPYHLHFQQRTGAPTAEVELNDTTPQPLPSAGPEVGWVTGSMSSATDVDVYSVNLQAGDTLFASLDLDPERDGVEWDGSIAIGNFANFILLTSKMGDVGPDSEASILTVKNAGTYMVRVAPPNVLSTFGTYALSVSVHPAAQVCTTYTNSTPVVLADAGQTTSALNVPDDVRIGDLDVNLSISHALPPDLDIHLIAPGGNDVGLLTDVGFAPSPSIDVTLDDEAALPIGHFNVLTGMMSEPESAYRLEWFDGQRAQGTWTLRVEDDTATNTGTLNAWGLSICSVAPPPTCPVATSPRVLFSTDFESGAAGFTHSGTADEWELGSPTLEPFTTCNSGASCFKTDLDGTYENFSNQHLVSPSIDLRGVVAPITLRWAQKYSLESAETDHANVEVRFVDNSSPLTLWEHQAGSMRDSVGVSSTAIEESAGWSNRTASLSSYAGYEVEVVFHVDSGPTPEVFGGMAVDDVSVIACAAVCGDAQVGPGEECDDGNALNGDCCSSTCQYDASGTACDDGTRCNGRETCNSTGSCLSGSPVTCMASDECHVAGQCDAPTGMCSNPTAPDGTPCGSGGMCLSGNCMTGGGGAGGAGGGAGRAGDGGAGAGGIAGGGGASGGAGASGAGGASGAAGMSGAGGGAGISGAGGAGGGAGAAGGGMSGAGGASGASGSAGQSGAGGAAGASGSGGGGGTPTGGGAGEAGAGGEAGAAGDSGGGAGGEAGDGATGGSATGGSATGGSATGGSATGGSATSGAGGEEPGGAGGDGGTSGKGKSSDDDSGCGCTVPGKTHRSGLPLALGAALVAFAARRRRGKHDATFA